MPAIGEFRYWSLEPPAHGRDGGREMRAKLGLVHVVHDAEDRNPPRHGSRSKERDAVLAVNHRVKPAPPDRQPAEDERIHREGGSAPDDLDAIALLGRA